MTTNRSSIQQGKQRESNMELFRCIAMFLVVAVHANFVSISAPSTAEVQAESLPSALRFIFQMLCIGSVDMFVLLSGWFGIHAKRSGFLKLLFQVFFCVTLVYLFYVAVGWQPLSKDLLLNAMGLDSSLWFVRDYIGLYLLSPVLNMFIEKASQRQYEGVLVGYFLFELLFGWLFPSAGHFSNGYSLDSFIFLYLLARYVRLYQSSLVEYPPRGAYLLFYLLLGIAQGCLSFVAIYYGYGRGQRLYFYCNPFVIAMSLSLLLFFSRFHFRSRIVNWLAASSFSVYLLHCGVGFTFDKYKMAVRQIYESYSGISCLLLVFLFLIAVYIIATLYDQLRIASWKWLNKFSMRYRKSA